MMQHLSVTNFLDKSRMLDHLQYISGFNMLESEGLRGLLGLVHREANASKATSLVIDGVLAAEEAAPAITDFKCFVHELQALAQVTDYTIFMLTSSSEVMCCRNTSWSMVWSSSTTKKSGGG